MGDPLIVILDTRDHVEALPRELTALQKSHGDGGGPFERKMVWMDALSFDLDVHRTLVHVPQFDVSVETNRRWFREGLDAYTDRSIYIATHEKRLTAHRSDLQAGLLQNRIKAVVGFTHTDDSEIHKALLALVRSFTVEQFDATVQAFADALVTNARGLRQWVHLAHHELGNVFRGMHTDLFGWQESGWNTGYLAEIVEANKSRPFDYMSRARAVLYHDADLIGLQSVETFFDGDAAVCGAVDSIAGLLPVNGTPTPIDDVLQLMKSSRWDELRANNGKKIDELGKALKSVDEAFDLLIARVDAFPRAKP